MSVSSNAGLCCCCRHIRHPGYLGWFMWSISTQVLLANPICTGLFSLVVRPGWWRATLFGVGSQNQTPSFFRVGSVQQRTCHNPDLGLTVAGAPEPGGRVSSHATSRWVFPFWYMLRPHPRSVLLTWCRRGASLMTESSTKSGTSSACFRSMRHTPRGPPPISLTFREGTLGASLACKAAVGRLGFQRPAKHQDKGGRRQLQGFCV